jgi:Flp pilus assembly protein TadB
MSDLITPIIVGSFGAAMLLVIYGFILVRQRSGRPRFESQDYYKSYRTPDRFSQKPRSPFREDAPSQQEQKEQRTIIAIIIGLAVGAIAIAAIFDYFEVLLIIFLLPVIIRYVRTRNQTRRREPQDESHSY